MLESVFKQLGSGSSSPAAKDRITQQTETLPPSPRPDPRRHPHTHTHSLRKTSEDDAPFKQPPELKLILQLTSKPADGRQR